MHPRYLSNAFVVGEGRGGAAVIIDSGAPITPLLQFATTQGLDPGASGRGGSIGAGRTAPPRRPGMGSKVRPEVEESGITSSSTESATA